MEKPKDEDENPIEPTVNDAPDLFQLIDWMFFAGTPLGDSDIEEPATGEENSDESEVREEAGDDDLAI